MAQHMHMLAIFNLGAPEMIVIGIVALLIFGKRLPEVARSLGKGVVEFKKGLRDTGDEINQSTHELPRSNTSQIDKTGEKSQGA